MRNKKGAGLDYLKRKQATSDTPALLCSVRDNIEATVVESLLKSSNIPVMKKWRNGGDIVMLHMAMSSTGVEIYVPSKLLDEAKMLLSAEPVIPVIDETDETVVTDEPVSINLPEDYLDFAGEKAKDRRSKARLIIFLLFGLPILIFALLFLWYEVSGQVYTYPESTVEIRVGYTLAYPVSPYNKNPNPSPMIFTSDLWFGS